MRKRDRLARVAPDGLQRAARAGHDLLADLDVGLPPLDDDRAGGLLRRQRLAGLVDVGRRPSARRSAPASAPGGSGVGAGVRVGVGVGVRVGVGVAVGETVGTGVGVAVGDGAGVGVAVGVGVVDRRHRRARLRRWQADVGRVRVCLPVLPLIAPTATEPLMFPPLIVEQRARREDAALPRHPRRQREAGRLREVPQRPAPQLLQPRARLGVVELHERARVPVEVADLVHRAVGDALAGDADQRRSSRTAP